MSDPLQSALGLDREASDRLLRRLEGLTDDEYFWEPAPGCWSVRPDSEGRFIAEWEHPVPQPAPLTTIAARMWHLGARPWDLPPLTRDAVIAAQFGGATYVPDGAHPRQACATAAEAIESLARNMDQREAHYGALNDHELYRRMGDVAGRYADNSYADLLIHFVDEHIHHSAEVALMRDLYRVLVRTP